MVSMEAKLDALEMLRDFHEIINEDAALRLSAASRASLCGDLRAIIAALEAERCENAEQVEELRHTVNDVVADSNAFLCKRAERDARIRVKLHAAQEWLDETGDAAYVRIDEALALLDGDKP